MKRFIGELLLMTALGYIMSEFFGNTAETLFIGFLIVTGYLLIRSSK